MSTSSEINPKDVPKLPVVTACIIDNHNSDLEICIESLRKQDYPMLQPIVIEREENVPIGMTKNKIIKNPEVWQKTSIFVMLNSNIELFPNAVSKYVMKILQYPQEIGIVYSDYWVLKQTKKPKYQKPYDRGLLEKDPSFLSPVVALNKLALDKYGVYKDSLDIYEDYDLAMRITQTFIAIHIPEMLFKLYNV